MFPKPQYRILVCGRGQCADREQALDIETHLNQLITEHGLDDPEHPKSSVCRLVNCLGICYGGTVVMVHPDGTLYGDMTTDKIEQVVEQHILNGEPIAEMMHVQYAPRPKTRRMVRPRQSE